MKYLTFILTIITVLLWIRVDDLIITDQFIHQKIESLEDKYKSTETYQKLIGKVNYHKELREKYQTLWENCPDYDAGQTFSDCMEYVTKMTDHMKDELMLNIDASSYLNSRPDIKEFRDAQNQLKKARDRILLPLKALAILTIALVINLTYSHFFKKSA